MRLLLINIVLLISIQLVLSQNTGIYPPIYNWKQINSDTVRIIFPNGMEDKAQRVSFLTHQLARTDSLAFGSKPGKVNIFLINQTAESNGYIRFAPFHGKFFSTAPQYAFAGTVDWFDLLAVHEYRHVMQLNGSKTGLPGLTKKLFGESFWAGLVAINLPGWFLEGDAVWQETSYSYSGRGRIPDFKMRMNSIADLEKPFSYEKMRCGSYRDLIPDAYALGYRMIKHGIDNYGIDLWNKVYKESITYKNLVYPFSRSLKKYTGYNTSGFYQKSMDRGKTTDTEYVNISAEKNNNINIGEELEFLSYPKFSDSELYIIKSSFSEAPYILKIDPEFPAASQKILPLGFGFDRYDVSDKYIVWNEINEDKRWSGVSYSDLYKYDLILKKKSQITRKKKLFSPSISPDNRRIAAVDCDINANYRLVVLDMDTGKELFDLSISGNYFFRETAWLDNENIITIAAADNENSLVAVNLAESRFTVLIPGIINSISDLVVSDKKIFFTSYLDGENGVQEIFCFNTDEKIIYRKTTTSNYGQLMPAIAGVNKLAWCEKDFNKTRLVICKEPWTELFKPDNSLLQYKKENLSPLRQNSNPGLLDNKVKVKYPVMDFRPHYKLINFYSWIPLYFDPFITATFYSRDYLDRLQFSVSPGYNLNDGSFNFNTELEYGELFPVINISMNNIFYQEGSGLNSETGIMEKFRFNTLKLTSSIGIPLNFQKHNYRTGILPELALNAFRNYGSSDSISENEQFRMDFMLRISKLKLQAYRAVVPENSLFLNLKVYNIQNRKDYSGGSFELTYYLPSFIDNHGLGIKVNGLYNSKTPKSDRFRDINSSFSYARGYDYSSRKKMLTGFRLNYSLPLVYPDFALGKFIFFKRIRTNLYFDMDRYKEFESIKWQNQRSAGIELFFDNTYFRMFQLPLGVGLDYLMDVPGNKNRYNIRLIIGL